MEVGGDDGCLSSSTDSKRKHHINGDNSNKNEKLYRGIRMRKWGKWVAEIREPNKRSRIWLGSYSSPVAAARAYDTAVFYLRGPTARLNFPESISDQDATDLRDLSAAAIRKKATEVGAKVDAQVQTHTQIGSPNPSSTDSNSARVSLTPDLNESPSPESSDDN